MRIAVAGKFITIMKTPTLIIRLLGLYLLGASGMLLHQMHRANEMAGRFAAGAAISGDVKVYGVCGLIIGVIAAVFAGPLARILTFDSEPQEKARDLTDTLRSGKS